MSVLTGEQIEAAKIITPFKERAIVNGMSYGKSLAGYDIRIRETVHLWPRDFLQFGLASSIEHFSVPVNVVGLVKDKSSWARQGLSVFNTVIEPGWRGYLTLELVTFSKPLKIEAGSPIAQVLFFYTAKSTDGYEGKYQDQGPVPIRAIMEEDDAQGHLFDRILEEPQNP